MPLVHLRKAFSTASSTPSAASAPLTNGDFERIYEQSFALIWRAARRLGIDPADTDDVVQEVFVVAHRKLPEFEGRAQVKTWLFKILVRVVHRYFRTQKRKPGHRPSATVEELGALTDTQSQSPAEAVERAEAVRILDGILGRMEEDKREVFVLAEVEQMSVVEIADVLGTNLNTVYSRLRAARQEFQRALSRFQMRELGGKP
jgi:RNA polymerase sigma-70 factor (ECF subfamily)